MHTLLVSGHVPVKASGRESDFFSLLLHGQPHSRDWLPGIGTLADCSVSRPETIVDAKK
jgi:hypothetical protein